MAHHLPDLKTFKRLADDGATLIPIGRRLLSDQLTPVLAYRRLVRPDDRMAPSFLLESVVGGERISRYSFLGAQPIAQVIAHGHDLAFVDARAGGRRETRRSDDPLAELDKVIAGWKLSSPAGLPAFTGGWVGLAGYDTVRYL